MPLYSKVAVVIALVALALFASFALTWPTREVTLGGRALALSGRMLLGLLSVGLAVAGADAVVRSNPALKPRPLHRTFLWHILPAAITAAAWLLLARLPDLAARVTGIVAGAGALALLVIAEYEAQGPATRWRGALGIVLQFAAYAVAALLYGAIYPAAQNATVARAVTVISALLALRLLGEGRWPPVRILGASAGIGLLLGAISWLLHGRAAGAVAYSLTLVVYLYVAAGLTRHALRGKVSREVAVEYLLVGFAALVLLFFAFR